MRIVSTKNGTTQKAYKVSGKAYKCFPQSINTLDEAKEFEQIEDAAVFLINNPTWGIRMNPGVAIIYRNIEIHR
jgi:hypothetical protein